jgi:hypothetical protein
MSSRVSPKEVVHEDKCAFPVKRHRGEPGHTRDTRTHGSRKRTSHQPSGKKTPGGAGTHIIVPVRYVMYFLSTYYFVLCTVPGYRGKKTPGDTGGSRDHVKNTGTPVKRHRGEPGHTRAVAPAVASVVLTFTRDTHGRTHGTHTGHTRDHTGAHGRTRAHGSHTDEPHKSQPSKPGAEAVLEPGEEFTSKRILDITLRACSCSG